MLKRWDLYEKIPCLIYRLAASGSVQRSVRCIRRIHFDLSVMLISCSTLADKKDSFDVSFQATLLGPAILQPSLCFSNLSGDLFQLLVHPYPLLFFVRLEQILAQHYQSSSINGGPECP